MLVCQIKIKTERKKKIRRKTSPGQDNNRLLNSAMLYYVFVLPMDVWIVNVFKQKAHQVYIVPKPIRYIHYTHTAHSF